MKALRIFFHKNSQSTWLVMSMLLFVTIGVIIACGKLTDDTNAPSAPVGTTGGGTSIPVGPQSSWGTYSLTLTADPTSIPADGISYTGLHAKLTDTSGRSLENFMVTFNTTGTSDGIGYFYPFIAPQLPDVPSSTLTGRTNSNGTVSARMYGAQSGSVVVQATIDIDEDGFKDLFTTTVVVLTPAADTSSAGSYRLSLTANPTTIMGDGIDYSSLTATVSDWSGGSVNGLNVSFSVYGVTGSVSPSFTATDDRGVATARFSVNPPSGGSALIMARVYIPDLLGYLTKTIRIAVNSVALTPTPVATSTPVVLTLSAGAVPATVPAAADSSTITVLATLNGAPVSNLQINLVSSITTATFASSSGPTASRTTNASGIVTDVLNYTGAATPITVTYTVAPGQAYSGTGTVIITFL